MKTIRWFVVALLGLSFAAAQRTPEQLSYRTFRYTCDAGKKLDVVYVQFGDTNFVRLTYLDRQYALAPATSASGARFASLTGPVTTSGVGSGLEWWEAGGAGTLSTFKDSDTAHTLPLLTNCRSPR